MKHKHGFCATNQNARGIAFLLTVLCGMVFLIGEARCTAQNWPEFRGPEGKGTANCPSFPVTELKQHIRWEVELEGKAWSSPVIWDDQVWVTNATEDGVRMWVSCFDLASGKRLHHQTLHEYQKADLDFCHETNSYASPTPVIEAGRIYTHFGRYGTSCLDTQTGEILWQRTDLECDHYRGPASSPILYGDLVIVAFDGADQQYVVALSKQTGETVWKTDREIDYGTDVGDRMKSYGTGTIFRVDGKPLLVYPSAVATIAYEPSTGSPIWTVYHDGMNASARPLQIPSGDLLISNGMGQMIAVNPVGTGNITEQNIRWKLAKGVAKKSTPLVIGERIFMVSDQGIASCLDPADGRVIWQSRLKGKFSSSPVFDGQSILIGSEEGVLYAFAAEEEFKLLGKTTFDSGFKATPALVDGQLVLRSFYRLYCIDPPESDAKDNGQNR